MSPLLIVVILGFCIAVNAQAPKPCETPAQWQCDRTEVNRQTKELIKMKYFYDLTNLRKRHIEVVKQGSEVDYFDRIEIYKEKKEYRVNLKEKTCQVVPLTRPFHVYQVSMNDTFEGEASIGNTGVEGEGVTIQMWSGYTEERSRFYGVWTLNGCLPVHQAYYNNVTGFDFQEDFYDVSLGVDPNAFIPPQDCH